MSVFVMAGGALLGYFGFADRYGVAKLAAIERGTALVEISSF